MGQNEIEKSATEWVFKKNGYKWFRKDDSAEDNKRSFIAGADCSKGYYEELLLIVVDLVWNAATESEAVPSTKLSKSIIEKAKNLLNGSKTEQDCGI